VTATFLRARVLLEEARALGLDVADLVAAADAVVAVPTLGQFVDEIVPTFTPATAATYRPYWRLAVALHGDRRLSELGPSDLQAVVEAAAARARANRPSSTGQASRESCVAALRALYQRGVAAGLLTTNPAATLTKPRRPRPRRRALDDTEQSQLLDSVRATSPDPRLHLLVIRLHLETGARRSGALALHPGDLDARRATVWLTEKHSVREQPVSPSLLAALARHAHERTATSGDGGLLRRRDGRAITGRDYDRLFAWARAVLPWAGRTPLSAHVLRHTAITVIGRIGGYPVAQAFAGHTPPTVTGRYLHASLADVAAAVEAMTGEHHPLAPPDPSPGRCQRR
jgi:integrase/recombinase XerC